MKNFMFIFCVFVLLFCAGCDFLRDENESNLATSLETSNVLSDHEATSENDSSCLEETSSHGAVSEQQSLGLEYDFVDLTNLGQTEFYPKAKAGDTINGLTISNAYTRKTKENGMMVDRHMAASFQGEVIVETLFWYDGVVGANELYSPHQMIVDSALGLPTFADDGPLLDIIYINSKELDDELEKQWQSLQASAAKNEGALFYCKTKVDNMTMGSLRESMTSRDADGVELFEIRFERFMTSRDYNDAIDTGSLFHGYGS